MAINTGVNVSKMIAYMVAGPLEPNIYVSKLNAYMVAGVLEPNILVTKLNAYVVCKDTNVTPPIWGDWSFSNGVVFVPYDQSWDMPTAAITVSYSVVAGSLPPGLSLAAIDYNKAHISGIPGLAGTYNFTLRATNTFGTADKAFTIVINGPGTRSLAFAG